MGVTEDSPQERPRSRDAVEPLATDRRDLQGAELEREPSTSGQEACDAHVESGGDRGRRRWLPLVWLGAVFAIGDFLLPRLMDWISPSDWQAVFVVGLMGWIPVQAGLVAIWSALGPGPHATRMLAVAAAVFVGCVFFLLGVVQADVYRADFEEILRLSCCLPLIYLAIQAPMWPLRILFGWRIEQVGPRQVSQQEGPLSLRQMMIATAALAAALALPRLAGQDARDNEFLLGVAVFALAAAGASLLTTVPAVAFLLGVRRIWLGLLAMLFYILACIAVAFMILAAIALYQGQFLAMPRIDREMVFRLILAGSFIVSLTGSLLIVRWCGYRLRRRERGRR